MTEIKCSRDAFRDQLHELSRQPTIYNIIDNHHVVRVDENIHSLSKDTFTESDSDASVSNSIEFGMSSACIKSTLRPSPLKNGSQIK